jgi:catechol 2,3-dioxygenase-like lactoylglutathione lyase family enzyme
MKPRITVLTLGVNDLEKAVKFYSEGLGFSTGGIVGNEFEYGAVAFFQLQHGVRLALWPRKSISQDTDLKLTAPSATDFTIGHNVASKAEVDQVVLKTKTAGAKIITAFFKLI